MNILFYDETGAVHLFSAILALITGTMVLFKHKGTISHRRTGYVYVINMLILNITAFMLTRLFNGYGIFHIAALISLLTLIAGMIPVIRKKPKNWVAHHFSWMYWSVIGLYAAFASEILTRVPSTPFFGMVGIATGVIMAGGYYGFYINKKRWEAQFLKSI